MIKEIPEIEKHVGLVATALKVNEVIRSLNAMESQTTDKQPLKAEIAALADELESMTRDEFNIRKHVLIAGLMRQLSAI